MSGTSVWTCGMCSVYFKKAWPDYTRMKLEKYWPPWFRHWINQYIKTAESNFPAILAKHQGRWVTCDAIFCIMLHVICGVLDVQHLEFWMFNTTNLQKWLWCKGILSKWEPRTLGWGIFLGGGFRYFFIVTPIWGNDPIWLIFFKWVETTN